MTRLQIYLSDCQRFAPLLPAALAGALEDRVATDYPAAYLWSAEPEGIDAYPEYPVDFAVIDLFRLWIKTPTQSDWHACGLLAEAMKDQRELALSDGTDPFCWDTMTDWLMACFCSPGRGCPAELVESNRRNLLPAKE